MHAAKAMLGEAEDFAEPPFFWTMQYGNSIKFTGSSAGHDEIVFRGDVDNDTFSAGYFRKGNLAAVSTIGRGRDVLIAGELLKERVKVSPAQFRDTEDLETLLP
jgi:3-phenylpropionate/trans-cinnamate dioxygenase ferredoxin reductase subunit